MLKTHHGSCHCKAITFTVELDLEAGTGKCNCTICWKRRMWGAKVRPAQFTLLTGKDNLTAYPAAVGGPSGFCKTCGVVPFGWTDPAEWNDGAMVTINVAALDDLDPAELVQAKVQLFDGRNNNWWNVPAESRHL